MLHASTTVASDLPRRHREDLGTILRRRADHDWAILTRDHPRYDKMVPRSFASPSGIVHEACQACTPYRSPGVSSSLHLINTYNLASAPRSSLPGEQEENAAQPKVEPEKLGPKSHLASPAGPPEFVRYSHEYDTIYEYI